MWNRTEKFSTANYVMKWPLMNEKAEKRGRKRCLPEQEMTRAAWPLKK